MAGNTFGFCYFVSRKFECILNLSKFLESRYVDCKCYSSGGKGILPCWEVRLYLEL